MKKQLLLIFAFISLILYGCAGGGGGENPSLLSGLTGQETIADNSSGPAQPQGPLFQSAEEEEKYYADLEKALNAQLDAASPAAAVEKGSPNRAPATLSSISLNKTTDSIQLSAPGLPLYDLSTILVTARMSDASTKPVTPVWTKYSGGGTLAGTIFTPPAAAGTTVFRATYTEGSVTRTTLFRLTIVALTSITLNKTTDEIKTLGTFDVSSLIVTAKYFNGTQKDITADPGTTWVKTSGAGTFSGTVYTAALNYETARLTASYNDSGVVRTVNFNLIVNPLWYLSLNKTTDSVQLLTPGPTTYDLTPLIVTARYRVGAVKDITSDPSTTLVLTSGGGTLAGKLYTLPATAATAVFTFGYTDSGITRTVQFRLTVNGLSSITLNKTVDSITPVAPGPTTYDLSTLTVTANYQDGTKVNVTSDPGTSWVKYSGGGTLTGKLYTAPLSGGTIYFRATYTDTVSGVTKTVNFRLNLNGISSITLNKTIDTLLLVSPGPNTYDLSTLKVTANYQNGTTAEITTDPNLTWTKTSGVGSLAGKFYTGTISIGNVYFQAKYTDPASGVVKTVNFRLILNGVTSITLGKTTDSVTLSSPGPNLYDLSAITITANYYSGAPKIVTSDAASTWTKISGTGTLAGKTYTASLTPEISVFTARYTEAGIARTRNFTLTTKALSSISLNKTADELVLASPGPTTYDLSTLIVTALYSDSTTANVTASPNMAWAVTTGGGTLSGNIYTAPAAPEIATLTASFTESGFTKTAVFQLNVTALNSISLNPSSGVIVIGSTFNISSVAVIANMSNGTTNNVTVDANTHWTLTSGLGTFDGAVYTATANTETAIFNVSYTESGVTRSIAFSLIVSNDITPPSVVITDTYVNSSSSFHIASGSKTNITATFTESDQIDETMPPRITIASSTATVVNNAVMTEYNNTNKVWRYLWTVPMAPYRYYRVTITAYDRAGNLCTAPTGKITYVIFNPTTIKAPYPPVPNN